MEQQYTTLTKDINNIDNKDAIVYAYIKSRMNYKTSIADNVTEKEISEKLGISLSTVKRSVERLKKNKNLISNNVIAEGSYKTYNKYHVAKCNENFFYIYNSFFNDDMNIGKASERTKLKNFLLKLKAICKKETNKYISESPHLGGLNKTELSKKLGIDTKTLNKYLEMAVNAGQIKYITNGLLILNKSIIPDFKEADSDTRIYHSIYNHRTTKTNQKYPSVNL